MPYLCNISDILGLPLLMRKMLSNFLSLNNTINAVTSKGKIMLLYLTIEPEKVTV